jgi:hypothetical protein
MNAIDLLAGFAVFLSLLLMHALVWNRLKNRSEIKGLLMLFVCLPIIVFIGLAMFGFQTVDLLAVSILYFSLAGAYIMTYPGLATEIPSFRILKAIDRAGKKGMTAQEITGIFDRDELINSRVKLMERDHLVEISAGGITLMPLGSFLADLFIAYRKICGRELGKG